MAASDYRFRLTTGATTYAFDFSGEWTWSQVPVYKEAAGGPVVEEVRTVWTVRGNLVLGSTPAAGWTAFAAALARFEVRGANFPSRVEIVLDPTSATPTVVLTLGGSGWEDFRVEEVSGDGPFDHAPAATHRSAWPITVRFSALRRSADAAGIVGWEQTITREWVRGLLEETWETTITTLEGVSAVDKVQQFGLIPVAALGDSFSYLTNGGDGIDFEVLDADQRDQATLTTVDYDGGRVPKKVRGTCTVRQWGVPVGATAPGTRPDKVSLVHETTTKADEEVQTIRARAEGPGAVAWVEQQAPTGGTFEKVVSHDRSERIYEVEWTLKRKSPKAELVLVVETEVSGGRQAVDFDPVPGYRPVRFDGPLLPYTLSVTITLTKRGGTGGVEEMRFPAELPAPWVLVAQESSEGEPKEAEASADDDQVKWERKASLVYKADRPPRERPAAWLRQNRDRVDSYLLGSV